MYSRKEKRKAISLHYPRVREGSPKKTRLVPFPLPEYLYPKERKKKNLSKKNAVMQYPKTIIS